MTSTKAELPSHPLPPLDPAFDSSDYKSALEFLTTTYPPATIRLGLGRIRQLLGMMGRPQDTFLPVIVAGTNGKGSTSCFLESIFIKAGLSTGLNLSPHLEQPTERIRVNGDDIPPLEFAGLIMDLAHLVDSKWSSLDRPTYHELLTAASLVYFSKRKVDIAIMEVGLGGRFDAANAVDAPFAIITPISYDHTEILGNNLTLIAREKAAVIRSGAVVVLGPQEHEALAAIVSSAKSVRAAKIMQHSHSPRVQWEDFNFYIDLNIDNLKITHAQAGIGGARQGDNALTAIRAALAIHSMRRRTRIDFNLDTNIITQGLVAARLPGRFETISREPWVVLDGAHNPQGAECLAETLELTGGGKWHFVVAMKSSKDPRTFFNTIARYISVLSLCPIKDIKSYEAGKLREMALDSGIAVGSIRVEESLDEAIKNALANPQASRGVMITGSLYAVGEARSLFRQF